MNYNQLRRSLAASVAATFLLQSTAWAASCPIPSGGFSIGQTITGSDANFAPGVFTGSAGGVFVNDLQGGHNWVFDQGSTTCRVDNVTRQNADGTTTTVSWSIPPNTSTQCIVLPIIKGGKVVNLGDIPLQGDVVTPVCDPSHLSGFKLPDGSVTASPNPLNDRANQLGCLISHGQPTDSAHADSYMFVAGIKGGLFSVRLCNDGTTGKVNCGFDYYSSIPEGQKLTNASIDNEVTFAIATSIRRQQNIYACLNPLGDPGDPSKPIPAKTLASFTVPTASSVQCMIPGNNGLQVDLTTEFGPDEQPYFGGQRTINSFNPNPGGTSPNSWPQCIYNGLGGLPFPTPKTQVQVLANVAFAFQQNSGGHCGNAFANNGFTSALVTQPQALVRHGSYMYTASTGGPVVQLKVTVDPTSGVTRYTIQQYLNNPAGFTTGIDIAEDLSSLMVMSDPSGLGLAGQEVIYKLPLCEN